MSHSSFQNAPPGIRHNTLPFRDLQWLFPIAVLIHNGEEAIWMPGWVSTHAAQLPVQAPGGLKIRVALLVLTVAAMVVTELSRRRGPGSVWAYLTFGYVVAMLGNVFVPHVPASFIFRSYTPGVITAVALNLPVMSYLAVRAVRDGWVVGWKAGAFAIAVPVSLAGLIGCFLLGGKMK
jgi:hypothetical protein